MASFVTVGGSQARPLPGNCLSDFIGCASEGRAPENLMGLGFDRNDEIVTLGHNTAEYAHKAMNSRAVLLAAYQYAVKPGGRYECVASAG